MARVSIQHIVQLTFYPIVDLDAEGERLFLTEAYRFLTNISYGSSSYGTSVTSSGVVISSNLPMLSRIVDLNLSVG